MNDQRSSRIKSFELDRTDCTFILQEKLCSLQCFMFYSNGDLFSLVQGNMADNQNQAAGNAPNVVDQITAAIQLMQLQQQAATATATTTSQCQAPDANSDTEVGTYW